ncbi:DUF1800 family protein [Rhodopirellula sp. MGV]|uniref:DUF1800 domain-containing protein n=1 Tax=Rhodopirellula sp. MGV TaxID=2023130 RepID=UPI000B979DE7|nr:DUF1800 domain-containing protein [Rhodopirellula sp. MGV]OYP31711.1 hypothetical protein CGZ80_20670 [Rhodopirellula sp. MGV]PNY34011.1 DUF1800 domain-containing protein [Rhodopirellula baltica]
MAVGTAFTIDPDWAWERFTPTDDQPWGHSLASHLLRRGGFAPTAQQLEQAVKSGFESTLDGLTDVENTSQDYLDEIRTLTRAALASGSNKQLAAGWVYRMLTTPHPLLEKMTLFWHGHFATSATKVDDAELMLQQNELLRQHALGDFHVLLLEISRDPAMLIYLDSVTNRKSHPNENYAREIMELFSLGEGNYSETDIRELARCFTGWEIKRKRFRFNRFQHDTGKKTVLGKSGSFGGEDAVRIVSEQSSAPMFLCEKLVRFFVADDLKCTPELLQPLADRMQADDLQIAPTVKRILGSNLFFSESARARKVRSPVEFAIDLLRSLEGTTDTYMVAEAISDLGQGLYHPPSVKGWDGGRAWINSSTLLGRSNFVRRLVDHPKTRFGKQSLREYLDDRGVATIDDLLAFVQPILFAVPLNDSVRNQIESIRLNSLDRSANGFEDAIHLLCSLPEFQLS